MTFTLEQRIINRLLLESNMQVGLYEGKMGLVLFFVHYYKHTGLQLYDDTAGELMEELEKETRHETPIGFAKGLSGIGWGIEYMIQKGLVEGDSLTICDEIDKQIMEKDPRRITDYSLETGLEGLIHYVLNHIKGVTVQHSKIPFDAQYLYDFFQTLSNIPSNAELSDSFKRLSTKYMDYYENNTSLDYVPELSFFMDDEIIVTEDTLNSTPLGLKNGLSGYLLKRISEPPNSLDKKNLYR